MDNMPECSCSEEAGTSCDWELTASLGYARPGDDSAPKSRVDWELKGIPQLLAQAMLQAQIQALNERGLEVYAAWQRGCAAGDTLEQMVERVRTLIK